jgi:hypothetical protein
LEEEEQDKEVEGKHILQSGTASGERFGISRKEELDNCQGHEQEQNNTMDNDDQAKVLEEISKYFMFLKVYVSFVNWDWVLPEITDIFFSMEGLKDLSEPNTVLINNFEESS